MPSLNSNLHQTLGPIVEVYIGASKQRNEALKNAGQPVPPIQKATFLIDTGASGTCIDPSILQPLNLAPINYISVQTPSTNGNPVQCPVYDIQLLVQPTLNNSKTFQIPHIRAVSVIEAHLKSQGIDGLLGRDILDHCLLIYHGQTSSFTLAW